MSATVLQFKQPKVTGTVKRGAPDLPRWFCLNCETDQFKLYDTGTIHCATCGFLIRSIHVGKT